jgi:hypothetical protein
MANLKLLEYVTKVQTIPTTLAEAVPILLQLTAGKEPSSVTTVTTGPELLGEYYRIFVHPTVIVEPSAVSQYWPDLDEPDFWDFWAKMDDMSPELKQVLTQVLAWEPIHKPSLNDRRDTHQHNRACWRGQLFNKLIYHYPPTQVPPKKVPPKKVVKGRVDGNSEMSRVYFHLMRHGEVRLPVINERSY